MSLQDLNLLKCYTFYLFKWFQIIIFFSLCINLLVSNSTIYTLLAQLHILSPSGVGKTRLWTSTYLKCSHTPSQWVGPSQFPSNMGAFLTASLWKGKAKVKLLNCVWLFATPWTVAYEEVPPTMEFSRQECWSGLPFPSPGDLPNPGIEPRPPALQADSLLSEPQGKPKNTGVGSLSLLQQIFPTQESNTGLLHCRQIIYQLHYQGSQGIC